MRVRAMIKTWSVLAVAAAAIGVVHAQAPIEATTPGGDRVLLHPDGRWEYADPAKRAASPKPAPGAAAPGAATPVAAGACPPGSQGQLFGVGRCVTPGEPDYNRGSLSGKGR